jgi:hypothetical protein
MTGQQKDTGRRRLGGPGCLTVLCMVVLTVLLPAAALVAWVVNRRLRRRPDKLIARLILAYGLLGAISLMAFTDYPVAWWRVMVSWWTPGLTATWQDWLAVVVVALAYGPLFGAAGWLVGQSGRERSPFNGAEYLDQRHAYEDHRRRRVMHAAQRVHHTGGTAAARAAVKPFTVPPGDRLGPFLGLYQRGDLATKRKSPWRKGRYLRLPLLSGLVRHLVVLGASGMGKSETVLTVCEYAIRSDWQVLYISAKEPPSPKDSAAPRLAAQARTSHRTHRSLLASSQPFDASRGTTDEIRDKFTRIEAWGDPFWRHCANLLLGLVLDLSADVGRAVRSLPEIVGSLTRRELQDLSANDPKVRELVDALSDHAVSGAMTRYASMAIHLRDWIGGREAGGWCWDDADVCIAELPTGRQPEAGQALLRLMVREAGTYLFDPARRRKRANGSTMPVLLVVEEAGEVSTDEVIGREFVSLVERGRSAGVVVVLTAQDPTGLGDERAQTALFTNATTITYRQPVSAQQLADMIGTEWRTEASAVVAGDLLEQAGSARRQQTYKCPPQYLRELGHAEAVLFVGGRYASFTAAMAAGGYRRPEPVLVAPQIGPGAQPEQVEPGGRGRPETTRTMREVLDEPREIGEWDWSSDGSGDGAP